jgi:hypothetical protein
MRGNLWDNWNVKTRGYLEFHGLQRAGFDTVVENRATGLGKTLSVYRNEIAQSIPELIEHRMGAAWDLLKSFYSHSWWPAFQAWRTMRSSSSMERLGFLNLCDMYKLPTNGPSPDGNGEGEELDLEKVPGGEGVGNSYVSSNSEEEDGLVDRLDLSLNSDEQMFNLDVVSEDNEAEELLVE